jgi:hypothetical protein
VRRIAEWLTIPFVGVVAVACGSGDGAASPGGSGAADPSQSTMSADFEGPVYGDFASLTQASDAVVVGSIAEEVGREVDEGGDEPRPEGSAGYPMVFHRVLVEEVLAGDVGSDVVVGTTDPTALRSEELVDLNPGDEVMLFLDHIGPGEAPGIDLYDDFFVITGMANGAFDVEGSEVLPRAPQAFARGDGDSPGGGGSIAFDLDAVRQEVAEASGG